MLIYLNSDSGDGHTLNRKSVTSENKSRIFWKISNIKSSNLKSSSALKIYSRVTTSIIANKIIKLYFKKFTDSFLLSGKFAILFLPYSVILCPIIQNRVFSV